MNKAVIELKIMEAQEQVEKCARRVEDFRSKYWKDSKNRDVWKIYVDKWTDSEISWRHEEFNWITELKKLEGTI